jgi:Golgi nucleoside diphosphatase
MAKEKTYGANEFINKVNELMGNKYSKELVTLQGDTTTLQHTKIQSLILLEILEELRKLNEFNIQKPIPSPVSIPSASNNSQRT